MERTARANVTPVRQRTQYTCMSTSMMMCLQANGIDTNEDEVNRVMGAKPMQGASWEDAAACAQHYGMRVHLVIPCMVSQLKEWTDAGIPVMIAWNPEGREWSHASVVFDVEDRGGELFVHVADPNIPNPNKVVRVVSEDDFYSKWAEKWPKYLVRRPAMAIEREITPEGRQVTAAAKHKLFNAHWSGKVPIEEIEAILNLGAEDARARLATLQAAKKRKPESMKTRMKTPPKDEPTKERNPFVPAMRQRGGQGAHGTKSRRTERRKERQRGWDREAASQRLVEDYEQATSLLRLAGSIPWNRHDEPPRWGGRGGTRIRYPEYSTYTWIDPNDIKLRVYPCWLDGDWDDPIDTRFWCAEASGPTKDNGNRDSLLFRGGMDFNTAMRIITTWYTRRKQEEESGVRDPMDYTVLARSAAGAYTDIEEDPNNLAFLLVRRGYERQQMHKRERVGVFDQPNDTEGNFRNLMAKLKELGLDPAKVALDSKSKRLRTIVGPYGIENFVKTLRGEQVDLGFTGDERLVVLNQLLDKAKGAGNQWLIDFVTDALGKLSRGTALDAGTLKTLRQNLYRNRMRNEADLFRQASTAADPSYSGNPNGEPIYPNTIEHGYDQPLGGGWDIMKALQNRLLVEQGKKPRPSNPRLASNADWQNLIEHPRADPVEPGLPGLVPPQRLLGQADPEAAGAFWWCDKAHAEAWRNKYHHDRFIMTPNGGGPFILVPPHEVGDWGSKDYQVVSQPQNPRLAGA